MTVRYEVDASRKTVKKQLTRCPPQVRMKYIVWAAQILAMGLPAVRRLPGYHDEPLGGQLKHLRSVRLSGGYRLLYKVVDQGQVQVVKVERVSNHDYKT